MFELLVRVQPRFAETRFAEMLTLTLNPNFDESGRHQPLTLILANRVSVNREDQTVAHQ